MRSQEDGALSLVRGLGRVLSSRLRANDGLREQQQQILNEFDAEITQILTTDLISSSAIFPASGFVGGKIVEDTGSDKNTVIAVLASSLVGYMVNSLAVTAVCGKDIKRLFEQAAGTLPLESRVRGIVGDMAAGSSVLRATKLLVKLDKIPAAVLSPEELYVRNRLLSIFREARESLPARLNRMSYTLAGLASAYHGYKRNGDSILYGLVWGITTKTGLGLAIAQGYGKPRP